MEKEKHLVVEIITFNPEAIHHCMYCETAWEDKSAAHSVRLEDLVANLPGDHGKEVQELSLWAVDLLRRYEDRIILRVIDAASIVGTAKSMQYGINYYPAVLVDHSKAFPEWELEEARAKIDQLLGVTEEECVEC